jgi:hypothetical protein
MTTSYPTDPPRRIFGFGAALVVVALLILIGFGYCATRMVPGALLGRGNTTTITHDVVVQQIKAVAKLVSSEATVRDVIVYENTWYGSTKRSLVVVTGPSLRGSTCATAPMSRSITPERESRFASLLPS